MSPRVSDRQFASSKHKYTDPRVGERQPYSVTSIVNNYADPGKIDRMVATAVKIGPSYRKEWGDSAKRGTRIHANVGDWVQGKATDILKADEPYMHGVSGFCRATQPIWLQSERDIVWALGVGGRFDICGELHTPERKVEGVILPPGDISGFWMLDTKTGKKYSAPLEMQIAGYVGADGMIVYDEKGIAVDIEPMPYVTRWGGLYLNDQGVAELVEVAPTPQEKESAINAFVAQLAVRRWADEVEKARGWEATQAALEASI